MHSGVLVLMDVHSSLMKSTKSCKDNDNTSSQPISVYAMVCVCLWCVRVCLHVEAKGHHLLSALSLLRSTLCF